MPTQERTQNAEIVCSNIPAFSGGTSDDDRLCLAQRIASSRSFGRSKLLRGFLLYICSRHAQGQTSALTEHQIGIHVFGRFEGYNSNDDNIVRHYARTLRKRVEEYFATEGKHEELGLDIPRGGYIPVFYARFPEKPMQKEKALPAEASAIPVADTVLSREASLLPAAADGAPDDQPAPSNEPAFPRSQGSHRRLVVLIALCSLVAFATIAAHGILAMRLGKEASGARVDPPSPLWSQLFQKDRDTFLVVADSGLVIMEGLSGRPVSLDEYASGKYRAPASVNSQLSNVLAQELGARRYTSIVDLELVLRLSRLREVNPERMLLRYSRDLHMDNLRSGNAILLGSTNSNPWVSVFEQQLNFRFLYDPKRRATPVIVNQHPLAGEQPVYANDYDGPWRKTYGTISWLPNLDGTGKVLLIAGINMAGTQAAGSFVLDSSRMKPVLDRARAPDGSIRPFEILIESNNVAASSSRPHAVGERIGQSAASATSGI